MYSMISQKTIVVHKIPSLIKFIQNDIVAFNVKNGKLYEFNDVGNFIIAQAKKPVSIEKLLHRLTEVYDVKEQRAKKHLYAFIESCLADGILKIKSP